MKIIACAATALVAAMPFLALAEDRCDFDQAAIAQQLSTKAQKVPGSRIISSTELLWAEASGRTVRISYGGCVDLEVEVAISKPAGPGAPLSQDDLVRAVARYWSTADAKSLAGALAAGHGEVQANGEVRVIEFDRDVSDAFPFGFTVSLAPNHAWVSWKEL
jgi:hypothetical protein